MQNHVSIIHSRPSKVDFLKADVWCEYMYPTELEDLRRWGVDESQILEELIKPLEHSNTHPYYSIPIGCSFTSREALYIAVDALVGEENASYFGCVTLIDGIVTAITLFVDDCEVDVYCDPSDPAENRDSMMSLIDRGEHDVRVRIKPKVHLHGVELPPEIRIPISDENPSITGADQQGP